MEDTVDLFRKELTHLVDHRKLVFEDRARVRERLVALC